MLIYQPFKEMCNALHIGDYETYGIRVVDEQGRVVESISDISTDAQFVARLAQRCTEGELSPIHLRDIVLNSV